MDRAGVKITPEAFEHHMLELEKEVRGVPSQHPQLTGTPHALKLACDALPRSDAKEGKAMRKCLANKRGKSKSKCLADKQSNAKQADQFKKQMPCRQAKQSKEKQKKQNNSKSK
eukprot:1161917-Pelagomonas_calceolata.AAC.4